jgi:hypothetical protein
MFKRNYTFHSVDGTYANDHNTNSYYFWEASAQRFTGTGTKNLAYPNDRWKNVVCAVNIFGQTDYYKEPKDGGGPTWNAYCLVSPLVTSELLPYECRTEGGGRRFCADS